jgi:hypothetical protein
MESCLASEGLEFCLSDPVSLTTLKQQPLFMPDQKQQGDKKLLEEKGMPAC